MLRLWHDVVFVGKVVGVIEYASISNRVSVATRRFELMKTPSSMIGTFSLKHIRGLKAYTLIINIKVDILFIPRAKIPVRAERK
ncbi:hypothetical protein DFR86_00705 [Acidianus sulfidivorans JP7]|uniref:Uncharacterized protein n=1 Tax=Acidianus sulfidivorans JP7 TaxID=619593 RepID=A0A2U9IJL6_9CREN|nr:hypothetical protein [Acidianus sulfidivorans]AWR96210.1 hypothetical protein DFR86_00705 [Acidianus sulfidivorans JP7]